MFFEFSFFGVEIFRVEFALPSKGIYQVPDHYLTEEDIIFTQTQIPDDGDGDLGSGKYDI